ncbi:surfeit locus protein 2-like isoform X2 [Asterias amurensis]|uniref:surfeit locus protein 2-like isoform X2 n=1 Tax=Asterias amurensis TaxID=7602 RepID=UPI003AB3D429
MAAPSKTTSEAHGHDDGDLQHLMTLSKDVQMFLRMHPSLSCIGTGKVQCSLTGHEMPCKIAAMESYTSGRKYQRLREFSGCDLEQFKPHIVPSKKKGRGHQLFCTLTLRHMTRLPVDVQRHIKGKKYTRALAKYNECKSLGIPFKPCGKIPRKDRMEWDGEKEARRNNTDSEASDGESDDSMSDLLPDFQMESDSDEIEDDKSQEDVEDTHIKQSKSVKKRKNVVDDTQSMELDEPLHKDVKKCKRNL